MLPRITNSSRSVGRKAIVGQREVDSQEIPLPPALVRALAKLGHPHLSWREGG